MEQTCPNCGKIYDTELERIDDRSIQEQYPNEPSWKREQLISGLCSNECWNEYLGVPSKELADDMDDEEEEPDPEEDREKEEE
jgi:hypothetical protein